MKRRLVLIGLGLAILALINLVAPFGMGDNTALDSIGLGIISLVFLKAAEMYDGWKA